MVIHHPSLFVFMNVCMMVSSSQWILVTSVLSSAASQQHLEYILCTAEWSHVIKQTAPLLAFSLSVFTSVWHMWWKIFFSLSSSPTEKAARVQLLRGVVKLLKWKMKVSMASFASASRLCFYVCLWMCEISEATENFITLSLPQKNASLSVWHLVLGSIGTDVCRLPPCPFACRR